MTVEIIEPKDRMFGFDRCVVEDEYCDELRECSLKTTNDKFPSEDRGFIVIEICHYTKGVNFTEPDTWSWNIIYNAYGDNHYLCDDGPLEFNDKFFGSGYENLQDAIDDAVKAYETNLDDIKNFVEKIDEQMNKEE